MSHAGPVRVRRLPVLLALVVVLLAPGCSRDGCPGTAYRPDLSVSGAETPIRALEVWLGTHEGFGEPPDEGWIVEDPGKADADRVVITNDDGDGWWVATVRTDEGGYVVSEATDHSAGCEDELS